MGKLLVSDYTFDASAQTITFNDFSSISLDNVLVVTNVTDNILIYNFATAGLGGSVSTNVLTLDYDTTSMADADDLQIWYYDVNTPDYFIGGIPTLVTLEASYTAAQTNTAIASVSAGSKIVVTKISVINDALSPNVLGFRVGFGASTTPTTTGVIISNPGMIPGYIHSEGDGSGILGIGADGEDLRITSDTPGSGGELRVIVSYYTISS